MNFSNILSEIERLDPEVYERTSPRRSVIKNMTRKVGLAALPFALGSLFNKAYGKGADIIIDTLNFALTLEYLESEFYKAAVTNASSIGITGPALAAITVIKDHEVAHVGFLSSTISAAGGTPVSYTASSFDFSGGGGTGMGPFAAALANDYNLFLAVAQTFEDTGVRAYKGQAGNLASSDVYLTAALQIHSVEARHAAHIRKMRGVKSWITGKNSDINNPAVQPSYDGEEVTKQLTVETTGLGGKTASAATEAFDEPLTKDQVSAIVKPFFKA